MLGWHYFPAGLLAVGSGWTCVSLARHLFHRLLLCTLQPGHRCEHSGSANTAQVPCMQNIQEIWKVTQTINILSLYGLPVPPFPRSSVISLLSFWNTASLFSLPHFYQSVRHQLVISPYTLVSLFSPFVCHQLVISPYNTDLMFSPSASHQIMSYMQESFLLPYKHALM